MFTPIFLLFGFLASMPISAMDAEDTPDDGYELHTNESKQDIHEIDKNKAAPPKKPMGLSIGAAKAFLLDHLKKEKWNLYCNGGCGICGTLWAIAGPSYVLALIGSILTGLYCTNQRWIAECSGDCWNTPGDGGCNSDGVCYPVYQDCLVSCTNNNTATPHDPACIGGATMIPVPFILSALALCSPLIKRARDSYVDRHTHALNYEIGRRFVDTSDDDPVADSHMTYIGPLLIAANSSLMKTLSASQALMLAPINLARFQNLANDTFSEEAKVPAQKLLRMLEMDAPTLIATLGDKEAKTLFKDEPVLFQVLLQTLSSNILNNDDVQHRLKKILSALLGEQAESDSRDWDDALRQISQGSSINEYCPRRVIVESDNIELMVGEQHFTITKESLVRVSNKFKLMLSDFEDQTEFNLPKDVKPEWVMIVQRVANSEPIAIDERNILDVLDAANYFMMKPILEQCDNFLSAEGISESLIAKWRAQYGKDIAEKTAFRLKWRFCDQYNLLQNKKLIASKLIRKLMSVTGEKPYNDLFENLKVLNLSHVRDGKESEMFDSFKAKLTNHKFLAWAWAAGGEVDIVRHAVIDFCADPKNKTIVESAWVFPPKDLAKCLADKKVQ